MPDYPIPSGVKRRFKRSEAIDLLGSLVFTNPTTDAGAVRVAHSNGSDRSVQLVALPAYPHGPSVFPTGAGYRVKFPVLDCPGVIVWRFAQFDRSEPTGTDLRARLHDGTTERYWNGSAWTSVVAPDADWNTLAEVSDHLPDWDPDDDLGFVFELSTTDREVTPSLRGFRVVYDIDLPSEFNDWVYNALVGGMQDTLRPVKDAIVLASGSISLDWGAVVDGKEDTWSFGSVVAVYNKAADPWNRTNLLASYNSGTRIATLTSSPAAGAQLLVRVEVVPEVAVNTDPDHVELAKSPAVIFDTIDVVDLGEAPAGDSVVNEFVDPPTAEVWPAARHAHVDVSVTVTAPLSVDLHRLGDAVTSWLHDRRVLRSPTTGDRVTLRITDQLSAGSPVERSGLRTGALTFRLEHVYFQTRATVAGYGVKTIQVEASTTAGGSDDIEIGG